MMKMRGGGGGETQRSDTHETMEETSDVDLEATNEEAVSEEKPVPEDEQADLEQEKPADGEDAAHEEAASKERAGRDDEQTYFEQEKPADGEDAVHEEAASKERPGRDDEQTDLEQEKPADGEDAVDDSMAVDDSLAADDETQNQEEEQEEDEEADHEQHIGTAEEGSQLVAANEASDDDLQVMTPVKHAPHEVLVVTPVRRQLSFGSEASSASDKSMRQVGLMRFWSPAGASDKSMSSPVGSPLADLEEYPEAPPRKPNRMSMEDTIRGMLRRGELSVGGQRLSLTAENMRSVHESMRKSTASRGRPIKSSNELRGVLGGRKTNRRAKNEKPRQFEIAISMKHAICKEMYEQRLRFPNESSMLDEFSRAKSIRKDRLQEIWANRAEWAKMSQHGRANASANEMKGTKARLRREGGGTKREFPELVEKVRHWLDKERSHGHVVLAKHLAMTYGSFLKVRADELSTLLENEDLSIPDRKAYQLKRDKAMSQHKVIMSTSKSADKRGAILARWLGASIRVPNLTTQISEVEMQVRAELSWQYHDYFMSIISRGDDELRKFCAKMSEVTPEVRKRCVMGFSDQVPLWLKKTSRREVFAKWEVPTKKRKMSTGPEFEMLADEHEPKHEEQPHDDQPHEDQPHEDQPHDTWELAKPGSDEQRKHLTSRREEKSDRFRVTFEANQLVSSWFDPEKDPTGHVIRGTLIVPGSHGNLANIDERNWIRDERFHYNGQDRKGMSAGRTLGAWRKLRSESPELLTHFNVMSQPASNTDGVLLPWGIMESAAEYPLSLWMRDCYGPAFSEASMRSMFLSHQIPSLVLPKMTSLLQLTDTDFSHAFKAAVRRSLDEQHRRHEPGTNARDGPMHESFTKLGIREMAKALHEAMEHMIKLNEETNWVLAGLRRNGWLALRPDETGKLKKCDDQPWAQGMRLGCKRVDERWLKNRFLHLSDEGIVSPPNWARVDGAKDLSDFVHWHYDEARKTEADAVIELDDPDHELDEPEWQQAAQYQLPLDMRRSLAEYEKNITDEAKKLRADRMKKTVKRREQRDALKKLSDETKEELRATLQSTSRFEAMSTVVPEARVSRGQAKAKPSAKKKPLSLGKMAKKQQKRSQMMKAGSKIPKNEDPPVPLPPPSEAPPLADGALRPSGTWRVIDERAGTSVFGRSGEILGESTENYHVLLGVCPHMGGKERKEWVSKRYVVEIGKDVKAYKWQQMSLSRHWKQEILGEMGLLSEDLDLLGSLDEVDELPLKMPAGGISLQHIHLGWALMRWQLEKSGHTHEEQAKTMSFVRPGWTQPLYLAHEEPRIDVDEYAKVVKKLMSEHKLCFLPLGSHGHWVLLVVDRRSAPMSIRYYDSLPDESQQCREYAAKVLASLLSLGLVDQAELPERMTKVHQGADECGIFLLASLEREAAEAIGHGPAATGWPTWAASRWHFGYN
ncbi:unnamed protein product [Symbiodinium sp. CCMP2592]|nr:unnamed protein product [Symbiodinium sp. CCMP2592]